MDFSCGTYLDDTMRLGLSCGIDPIRSDAGVMQVIEWWQNLEPEGMRTFVTIGMASSLVLFIQMIVLLFGGAFDIPDFDLDVGSGGAAGMFSVRGIGAFFTGFGWTGATVLDSGQSLPVALIAATLVGGGTLACFVLLMRWIYSLRADGTMDYTKALNQIGSVYVPIPPRREGLGQIEILVHGRMATVKALSDNEERLENLTAVKVVELVDKRTLLVEKLSPGDSSEAVADSTKTEAESGTAPSDPDSP
ncbi:MAG TPA: hypothetical protein DIV54_11360 [Verrucomicrobiales bacterium]|nr:hypothetical protein [Verrucomicrobiales bacterium]